MADVTQILSQIEQGDPSATKDLLAAVYDQLRQTAAAKMAQERPDHTLQATALVHEAYVRLVGCSQSASWKNRRHFFAAAAEAMRRILVDAARQRNRMKRGGDWQRLGFDLDDLPGLGYSHRDAIGTLATLMTVLYEHGPRGMRTVAKTSQSPWFQFKSIQC